MKKIAKEFKEFIMRGNVIDLAVGVIIGAAFSAIINSLVKDVVMPLISLITGKIDFNNLFVALDGGHYLTVADAEAAGAALLKYGSFITAVINFLLIGICIFFFIKFINRLSSGFKPKAEPAEEKKPRLCPYCFGEIHDEAMRCPHCTSELPAPAAAVATVGDPA
jgi:large conductance mechanosensitive channel